MQVTATEAKNRFGQLLVHCQREVVTIEKSGRRHSVLMSAQDYDALVAQRQGAANVKDPGKRFYEEYKDWMDMQNEIFEKHGIWSEGLVSWQEPA